MSDAWTIMFYGYEKHHLQLQFISWFINQRNCMYRYTYIYVYTYNYIYNYIYN